MVYTDHLMITADSIKEMIALGLQARSSAKTLDNNVQALVKKLELMEISNAQLILLAQAVDFGNRCSCLVRKEYTVCFQTSYTQNSNTQNMCPHILIYNEHQGVYAFSTSEWILKLHGFRNQGKFAQLKGMIKNGDDDLHNNPLDLPTIQHDSENSISSRTK